MTTISPRRRKNIFSPNVLAWGALLLLVLALVFLFRTQTGSVAWRVLEPLVHARDNLAAASGSFLGQFASNKSLVEENARLRATLASTTAQLFDRDLLESQNIELKRRLGRIENTTARIAGVIARPPGTPYDTFIIDAGHEDGVAAGDFVSAGGSQFIGTVKEVYAKSARVVLYSSGGESYNTSLISPGRKDAVPIAIEGQGAGSFVGEVPTGVDVLVGDMATIPGLSERIIARVSAVFTPEGASFKKVYLQFPTNIFTLRFVEIYKSLP